MLYQTIVALCLNTTPVMDCNITKATYWIPWPVPVYSVAQCQSQGDDIEPRLTEVIKRPELYVKIICRKIHDNPGACGQCGEHEPGYSPKPGEFP